MCVYEKVKQMNYEKVLRVVFKIIELINETELKNYSKNLVHAYFKESTFRSAIGKAREAIIRHTQFKELPTLKEIQEKSVDQLDELDHLLLKLEYEAKRITY